MKFNADHVSKLANLSLSKDEKEKLETQLEEFITAGSKKNIFAKKLELGRKQGISSNLPSELDQLNQWAEDNKNNFGSFFKGDNLDLVDNDKDNLDNIVNKINDKLNDPSYTNENNRKNLNLFLNNVQNRKNIPIK